MKKIMNHVKKCPKRSTDSNSCPICRQFLALCCYHAKNCNLQKCSVPFCLNIRHKLKEPRRAQIRADMMMFRRMEGLSRMSGGPSLAASAAPLFPQMQPSNSHANLHTQQRPSK
uniref:histone acetyltransferase n=1 Tax=Acrobeloides nanus TaxID=290746 RepID=A0A914CTF5_9BILA